MYTVRRVILKAIVHVNDTAQHRNSTYFNIDVIEKNFQLNSKLFIDFAYITYNIVTYVKKNLIDFH